MKMAFTAIVAGCVGATATIGTAVAQESSSPATTTLIDRKSDRADNFDLDLNAPTAPGFVVIGATPKDVADPGSIKDFGIDVASFVSNRKLQPGLAISTAPFWWVDRPITLEQYRGIKEDGVTAVDGGLSYWQRVLARTQLSVATTGGQDKNKKDGVRAGIGVQAQLLDSQDQRFDVESYRCTQTAWDEHVSEKLDTLRLQAFRDARKRKEKDDSLNRIALRQEFLAKKQAALLANYEKARKQCEKDAEKRFLKASSWMVGLGVAAKSENGDAGDIEDDGASFWSSYRMAFGDAGDKAVVFFVKADADKSFNLDKGKIAEGDAVQAAISFALEEQTWKFGVTASYNYRDFRSGAIKDDDFLRYSATAAYKVKNGVWVEASGGAVSGAKFDEEGFGLVQLKLDLDK